MRTLQLHRFHEKAGASFIEVQQCRIPGDYGDVSLELETLNHKVALLDRSYLGKVLVKGPDAIDLLDRISTNDLQYLALGTVVDTVFATPKGRLLDYCRVINTNDGLLLIASFFHAAHLIDWINRFIILEDVTVSDVSDQYTWLTLLGPHAYRFISGITGKQIREADETIWIKIGGANFPVLKNTKFNVPAYNFCFDTSNAETVAGELLSRLKKMDGCLIGDTAFQIIRVESGMPDWGTEITQDYNPHEARLTHAISFTKGCYTGQEVIARLDTYDKVQKYLMIIDLNEHIPDPPPFEIYIDEESIGHLTSVIFDPVAGRSMGLGYVKKMYTMENDIYIEVSAGEKRIPARLRLPPQAYSEK